MRLSRVKSSLTILVSLVCLNCLSCSQENELDKAIDEALREADFDSPLDEGVSVRYFEETKAR